MRLLSNMYEGNISSSNHTSRCNHSWDTIAMQQGRNLVTALSYPVQNCPLTAWHEIEREIIEAMWCGKLLLDRMVTFTFGGAGFHSLLQSRWRIIGPTIVLASGFMYWAVISFYGTLQKANCFSGRPSWKAVSPMQVNLRLLVSLPVTNSYPQIWPLHTFSVNALFQPLGQWGRFIDCRCH